MKESESANRQLTTVLLSVFLPSAGLGLFGFLGWYTDLAPGLLGSNELFFGLMFSGWLILIFVIPPLLLVAAATAMGLAILTRGRSRVFYSVAGGVLFLIFILAIRQIFAS